MASKAVVLNTIGNAGYSASQVQDQSITLGDLLEAIQDAITEHGEEARVALYNAENQYGAAWGYISQWHNVFEVVGAEDDDEANLGYGDGN